MAKGTITVRLSEELLEAFEAEAKISGVTVSQIVVDAIEAGRKIKNIEEPRAGSLEVSLQPRKLSSMNQPTQASRGCLWRIWLSESGRSSVI